jgi:hypothetical protein
MRFSKDCQVYPFPPDFTSNPYKIPLRKAAIGYIIFWEGVLPHIFDNITGDSLSKALNQTLTGAKRADFCIGYFNLRGWNLLLDSVEQLSGGQLNAQSLIKNEKNIENIRQTYDEIINELIQERDEAVRIAQSYKKAATGEPLTILCANAISSLATKRGQNTNNMKAQRR